MDHSLSRSEVCCLSTATPGLQIFLSVFISRHLQAKADFFLLYNSDVFSDHNECSSNPCQNSGTCVDEFASYKCSCLNGYTGKNCEVGERSLICNAFLSNISQLVYC